MTEETVAAPTNLKNLDPQLPTPIVQALFSVLYFLRDYGWYVLGALIFYLLVKERVRNWFKRRQIYNPERVSRLDEERLQIRELQQKRWEENARIVYEAETRERKRLQEEKEKKRRNPDGSLKKLVINEDVDDGLPGYRPEGRAKPRRGGGG